MQYRNLKRDEYHQVHQLFTAYYDENVYATESRYFNWLHGTAPNHLDCASEDEYSVLAALDDGKVQACINYIPTEIYIDGQKYTAAVTAESLSSPAAAGLYGLLARRLVGRFDYCFMMGATPFLQDLFVKQLGAQYRHSIGRRLLISNPSALHRLLEIHPDGTAAPAPQLEGWADKTRQLATGSTWVQISDLSELQGDYWLARLATQSPSLRRDPAWLKWRYQDHPHIAYQCIASDAKQSTGIAIIRKEIPAGLDISVIRVLDFLPIPGKGAELAGSVAKFALDQGAAMVDFFCADAAMMASLPEAFLEPEAHLALRIPYLLQPPEWRARMSINLLSTLNRRKRRILPPLNPEALYLTKGDGAQDIALDSGYRSAHLRD